MIFRDYVKKCKKLWFLLEEGRFHNVFKDKPAKWPIAKKKPSKYKNPQLIHMALQEGLVIEDI
jgi:hypothetical protein